MTEDEMPEWYRALTTQERIDRYQDMEAQYERTLQWAKDAADDDTEADQRLAEVSSNLLDDAMRLLKKLILERSMIMSLLEV